MQAELHLSEIDYVSASALPQITDYVTCWRHNAHRLAIANVCDRARVTRYCEIKPQSHHVLSSAP